MSRILQDCPGTSRYWLVKSNFPCPREPGYPRTVPGYPQNGYSEVQVSMSIWARMSQDCLWIPMKILMKSNCPCSCEQGYLGTVPGCPEIGSWSLTVHFCVSQDIPGLSQDVQKLVCDHVNSNCPCPRARMIEGPKWPNWIWPHFFGGICVVCMNYQKATFQK